MAAEQKVEAEVTKAEVRAVRAVIRLLLQQQQRRVLVLLPPPLP